jgi:hypothetical protein
MSDEAFRPPGPCPVCGHDVPSRARACPGCGASHDSGWNEEASVSGLDLPDEDFDYGGFLEREFGERQKAVPARRRFWTFVALVVIGAMIAGFFLFRA